MSSSDAPRRREAASCDRHLPISMRIVTDGSAGDGPIVTMISVHRYDEPAEHARCECGAPALWVLRSLPS